MSIAPISTPPVPSPYVAATAWNAMSAVGRAFATVFRNKVVQVVLAVGACVAIAYICKVAWNAISASFASREKEPAAVAQSQSRKEEQPVAVAQSQSRKEEQPAAVAQSQSRKEEQPAAVAQSQSRKEEQPAAVAQSQSPTVHQPKGAARRLDSELENAGKGAGSGQPSAIASSGTLRRASATGSAQVTPAGSANDLRRQALTGGKSVHFVTSPLSSHGGTPQQPLTHSPGGTGNAVSATPSHRRRRHSADSPIIEEGVGYSFTPGPGQKPIDVVESPSRWTDLDSEERRRELLGRTPSGLDPYNTGMHRLLRSREQTEAEANVSTDLNTPQGESVVTSETPDSQAY